MNGRPWAGRARDPVAEHWRLRPITLRLLALVLGSRWVRRWSGGRRPGSGRPWPACYGPGSGARRPAATAATAGTPAPASRRPPPRAGGLCTTAWAAYAACALAWLYAVPSFYSPEYLESCSIRRVSDAGEQPSWGLALLWDGVGSYPRAQRCMDDRGGHAGSYKRADRSVMGMPVCRLGLLPAATAKAAAPPRWQTVAPKPPLGRDMRRT
jgi:hypothetical protein